MAAAAGFAGTEERTEEHKGDLGADIRWLGMEGLPCFATHLGWLEVFFVLIRVMPAFPVLPPSLNLNKAPILPAFPFVFCSREENEGRKRGRRKIKKKRSFFSTFHHGVVKLALNHLLSR